jgi:hypothetical protein
MAIEKSRSPLPGMPTASSVDWDDGDPLVSRKPANDNLRVPLPLFPEPATLTVAEAIQTTHDSSVRTIRGKVVTVAYGVAASIAVISWIFLIGASLLEGATWALDW